MRSPALPQATCKTRRSPIKFSGFGVSQDRKGDPTSLCCPSALLAHSSRAPVNGVQCSLVRPFLLVPYSHTIIVSDKLMRPNAGHLSTKPSSTTNLGVLALCGRIVPFSLPRCTVWVSPQHRRWRGSVFLVSYICSKSHTSTQLRPAHQVIGGGPWRKLGRSVRA